MTYGLFPHMALTCELLFDQPNMQAIADSVFVGYVKRYGHGP